MEKFNEIKELVNSLDIEAAKVDTGVKAARTRLRVGLQRLKVLAQVLRKEIGRMEYTRLIKRQKTKNAPKCLTHF